MARRRGSRGTSAGRRAALTLIIWLAGSAALAGDHPLSFCSTYELKYLGLSADVSITLIPDADSGELLYTTTTRPRGALKLLQSEPAVETTRLRIDDGNLVPQSYSLDKGNDDPSENSAIDFDWETGVGYSVHEGASAELPLEAGTLDRLSADLAAILALRAGERPRRYTVANRNEISTMRFTPMPDEILEIADRDMETVQYLRERVGSSRDYLIWYSKDAGWLPVRVLQRKEGKKQATLTLSEWTVAGPGEPAPSCAG